MAHVAFDLDCTLGFFEITNAFASLWSPDFLRNPEQMAPNGSFNLSASLTGKLKRARYNFASALLKTPELLDTVIRPNLDVVMEKLMAAKRARKLKTVIIYSNTGVTYSMELAKMLIERLYKAQGFFSLMADHWHPLREADHVLERQKVYIEPLKTISTLQKLFKEATRSAKEVPLKQILFVDDRLPKHTLQEQELDGLTYIVPSRFVPKVSNFQKKALLFMAMDAMDEAGLLHDEEYLKSGFCHRKISYHFKRLHAVNGFPDLFTYVWDKIENIKVAQRSWTPDTMNLSARLQKFLEQI
jgi:hypothetical protein